MALVKCPECGRENVSDSAEMCPSCGYGIKEYYARIRARERAIKEHEYKLSSVKMPEKPKKENTLFSLAKGIFIFCGVLTVLCLLLDAAILIVIPLMIALVGVLFYLEGDKKYTKEMEQYNSAKADFERYKKQEVERQESIEARRRAEYENAIKCPVCNSIKVEKITAVGRSVSIAAVGLASGKIGKQYKCKNCKHMW